MTAITATLTDGKRLANIVTNARLTIPAWGASYADVTIDGEATLSGAVTLTIADLTVKCTVLSGGPASGRSFYRLISGAAGWGKTLPKFDYANDAGVKVATVLGDAASAVGETLDTTTVDPTAIVSAGTKFVSGTHFVRAEGPACRLLEQIAPNAWYIGEDGVTRLGRRAKAVVTLQGTATSQLDLARGTVTFASESIANLLPGVVVSGLEAVDVEHEVSAKGGLRSKIWGKQGASTSRRAAALRAIVDQLDPDRKFRAIYQYRIVTQEGSGRLNLQPVYVSLGMPELRHVRVFPGLPGCSAQYVLGAIVLVGFIDGDPTRPVVLASEDQESFGFIPNGLSLAGGGPAVGRVGDTVHVTIDSTAASGIKSPPGTAGGPCTLTAGSFTVSGTIVSGSAKVTSG